MASKTANYNLHKIDLADSPPDITVLNENFDTIDAKLKEHETPSYTESSTLTKLTSGEKLSVAFGKIAKAISDFISHLANKSNPHEVTASQSGALPTAGGVMDGDIHFNNLSSYFALKKGRTIADGTTHWLTFGVGSDGASSIEHYTGTDEHYEGATQDCRLELRSMIKDLVNAIILKDTANNKLYQIYGAHNISASRTELGYVKGVTSAIQTQLNGKANTSHGTHVSFSSTNPVMDGTASVGSASTVSRSDHKHPSDTSRLATANVVNNLTTTSAGYALDARQGKALSDKINKIKILSGTVSISVSGDWDSASKTVTFSSAFSVAPIVQASTTDGNASVNVTAISTAGCTIALYAAASTGTKTIRWTAMGY